MIRNVSSSVFGDRPFSEPPGGGLSSVAYSGCGVGRRGSGLRPSRGAYLTVAGLFAAALVGAVIFFIDLGITKMRPQFLAFYSSAAFVFVSFGISMGTIWAHLVNYRNPRA